MIHQWNGLHGYYSIETQKFDSFSKIVRNWRNWILSVPRVFVPREKKSLWLRQFRSYISNWYINGKVFTSTTTWKHKNWFFFLQFEIEFRLFLKFEIEFWLVFWLALKSWNRLNFVNISPALVIDTSMERSSRVLQLIMTQKFDSFSQKNLKLCFDLCQRAEIVQASSLNRKLGIYMTTSGMHCRPFEGRHLVTINFLPLF